MNPTYVVAVGDFGLRVATRLKGDGHGAGFSLAAYPILDEAGGARGRLAARFRDKVAGELGELLRAEAVAAAGEVASRRLDLVLVASLAETGAGLLPNLAGLLARIIEEDFAVIFPAGASPEQRGVWMTIALATPAIDASAAGRAALDALAALERWHAGCAPRAIVNRIFILPQQNRLMPLSAADLEWGLYLFVSGLFGAGARETEEVRARLAPAKDPQRILATFAVAAADLDVARVEAAFAWRSGRAALERLTERCETRPSEERAAALVAGLDPELWSRPLAAARKPEALDAAEADALAGAEREIRALVDAHLDPGQGLTSFRLLLDGLRQLQAQLRARDGAGEWLPAETAPAPPAAPSPPPPATAPPASTRHTLVVGLLLALVIAAAAGAVASVAAVRSAATGPATGGPRVTGGGAAPLGADAGTTVLWGGAFGVAVGLGWSAWSRSRARRAADLGREATPAAAPDAEKARRERAALEAALGLRRRRVARVAARIVDDEVLRLEAVRAALREANEYAGQRLKEMGLTAGGGGDFAPLLAETGGLAWDLLPAAALPLLWQRSREVREEDEWATRLLVAAWPARGHRDDLPFAPGGSWEVALREQHRMLREEGAFTCGELDAALRRQLGGFLDSAPRALELGITPIGGRQGAPLPLSDWRDVVFIIPADGIALVSHLLREHSLASATVLRGDWQRSRVIAFRSAADFDVISLRDQGPRA